MTVKKELTELTELKALEVSLVDAGANNKKRFPIFKQEKNMDPEILKAVLETEVDEEAKLSEWLAKAKLSDKGQAAVKSVLRMLSAYKDELPKDVLDALAATAGYPAPKAKAKEEEEDEDEYPKPKDKEKGKEMTEDKKVKKAELSPEVEAVLKAQTTELETLKAQNEQITKALKTETDSRKLIEWTQKAEQELSHYPGKSTKELGAMLKTMDDKDPEFAKQQFEVLKSASTAFAASPLLQEAGRSGGSDSSGSAWEQIEKMANGFVEKSDGSLTHEKAVCKVLKLKPELYSKYLDEHPAQCASKRN
jgi:hypothetical protein